MKTLVRSILALGAFLFAVVAVAACGGLSGDQVAQVGGMSITNSTFNHCMGVAAASAAPPPGQKAAVPVPPDFKACVAQLQATAPKPAKGQPPPTASQFKAQCQQEYNSLRDQVLQFLINADWVLGEAKDQGIKVSDADVTKQFNTIKAQQFPKPGDLQKFMAQSGQTQPDLLLRVKLDLVSTKLRDKATKGSTTVTNAQIANFFNKNKTRFAQPERRDLRIILTKTAAQANAAKAAIQHGQSFATVAKKDSIDQATKSQGGTLLGIQRGQEEKALDDAIFSAQLHTLTGPIKTQFGYYIFIVQKVTPATQQTLVQATPTIKQQLLATQQQGALETFVKKFQKKWTGKTNCRTGYVVMGCKQYKAPKTSGLPGAPTTAPQGTVSTSTGTGK